MAKIKRTWQSRYDIVQENMGEGGNAIVHIVRDSNGDKYALKELDLSRTNDEKKCRFQDEIKIMASNRDTASIMPLIDSSIDEYWYVMPIAEPIMKAFEPSKFKSFECIQNLLISLAVALCEIHGRNLAHRDIKPDNIYVLDDRICFGDFGLVEFPDNPNDFTRSDRGLGAIFTIAPEMKRNPKDADGKKADVYSLAKTIWILLTGETKGFDGQYLVNGHYTLRNFEGLRGKHLVELENLLQQATNFDPDARPTIEQFVDELKNWKSVSRNSERYQLSEWNFLNQCLFGEEIPDTAVWAEKDSIINVLNVISSLPVFNHMLFSHKGGLDFKRASKACEDGCIEITDDLGFVYILKPHKLWFERFVDPSWNYFLLSIDKLRPVLKDTYEMIQGMHEEYLVEDTPRHYVSARYPQYGVYDYESGERFPEGYREVSRQLDGSFLFVMKNGFYNSINATYDGRHGMCHPIQFRQYIEQLCKLIEELKSSGASSEVIERFLNDKKFPKNPFKKDDDKENREPDRKKKDSDDFSTYIKKHILEWSFVDVIEGLTPANADECKVLYYIEYQDDEIALSSFLEDGRFGCCLDVDGVFKRSSQKIYYTDSMDIANNILQAIIQRIKNECEKAELLDYGYCPYPQISILKGDVKPSHVFTEDEIRELMKVADDRHDNTLVIDADGLARIESGHLSGRVYPVYTETWDAGNNYVGKYSRLSDVRPAYLRALNGWLMYLKTGRSQYVDCTNNECEEDLLTEIKAFY